MKKKIKLTDKNKKDVRLQLGEKAGKLLEILYKADIPCWLDSGSLLAIVRNKKLNTWEKDVDLGIWIDDFKKATVLSKKFASDEKVKFNVKSIQGVPYKLSYQFNDDSIRQLPFDIHIFYKIDGYAWSAQSTSMLKTGSNLPDVLYKSFLEKNKTKQFTFIRFIFKFPFLAFCIFLKRTYLSYFVKFFINVNFRLNYIFNTKYHNANSFIFGMFFKLYEWKVPVNYFENAKPHTKWPVHLLAPYPVKDYLSLRYGDDWMKPKSKWFYIVDDGCVFKAEKKTYKNAKNIFFQKEK